MTSIFKKIKNLFTPVEKVNALPLWKLKDKILYWNESRKYPSYNTLPSGISFNTQFWSRVKDIHRYTTKDGYERAINVWWVDGDFILTEVIKGERSRVHIPKQRVKVQYKPTNDKYYAEKFVKVNEKIALRKKLAWTKVPKSGKIKVQFLFNMHTHPRRDDGSYSYFSNVDMEGFFSKSSCITGLVTDKLWILMKTNNSKGMVKGIHEHDYSAGVLTQDFGLKVYLAEFGRSAVALVPSATAPQSQTNIAT